MKRVRWNALPPSLVDDTYVYGPLKVIDRRRTNAMRRYADGVFRRAAEDRAKKLQEGVAAPKDLE